MLERGEACSAFLKQESLVCKMGLTTVLLRRVAWSTKWGDTKVKMGPGTDSTVWEMIAIITCILSQSWNSPWASKLQTSLALLCPWSVFWSRHGELTSVAENGWGSRGWTQWHQQSFLRLNSATGDCPLTGETLGSKVPGLTWDIPAGQDLSCSVIGWSGYRNWRRWF